MIKHKPRSCQAANMLDYFAAQRREQVVRSPAAWLTPASQTQQSVGQATYLASF